MPHPSRPRHATVVAYLALFVALGGGAYAVTSLPANSVGSKQLKRGAVTRAKLGRGAVTGIRTRQLRNGAVTAAKLAGGAVTTAKVAGGAVTSVKLADGAVTGAKVADGSLTGRQINAATLGAVPTAHNADTLGGSTPSAFFPASKLRTFNVKLSYGETQPLFDAGTLSFSAKCVKNGTDPGGDTGNDFAELLVSTSANGGLLSNGDGAGLTGTGPTDFLNTDTAENQRAVGVISHNTGTGYGATQNQQQGFGMSAVDPNGVAVNFPDGFVGSVNLFGSDCVMAGFAMLP